MVFYNNRVSIADVNGEEIYLIRNIKDQIILNYYSLEGDIEEFIVADNVFEEFDVLINESLLYIVYQDSQHKLNLAIINGKNQDIHRLSSVDFPKVLELNLIKHGDSISMIFLYPVNNRRDILQIEHHILRDDLWNNYLVDQVRISKLLNTIKLINRGEVYI